MYVCDMQILDIVTVNATAGGWKLAQPHIDRLLTAFPESSELLHTLGLGDFGETQYSHVDLRSMQLALYALAARREVEALQWTEKLDWDVKLQHMAGKNPFYCRRALQNPHGGVFNLSLESHADSMPSASYR